MSKTTAIQILLLISSFFLTATLATASGLGICGSSATQRALIPDKLCVSVGGRVDAYQCAAADKMLCRSQTRSNSTGGYCSTLVSFASACNRHDSCYGSKGAVKSACDSAFYSDLKGACRSGLAAGFPESGRSACYNAAIKFNDAVRSKGCEAFKKAQKDRRVNDPQCN